MEFLNRISTLTDGGRGGDGRELSPKDNGGPDLKAEDSPAGFPYTAAGIVGLLLTGGGSLYLNRGQILAHAAKHGYTPEQLVEKILEALS